MADGFTPPQKVRENARRGLKLRKEFGRGGTEVGVARARDLSNGKSIPLKTINRMVSYFARHEVDKKGENWGNAKNPSRGYIAWLLWGGDAGKTWANSISERESKKDKSMAIDTTTTYAAIIKQEKQDDGTLLVYGKATDDSLDIDQQICDASWLEKAMPEWFKTGGNIREQHSNIAAGVAKELDSKSDGHYISALVVDPVSVKKVETGVLKGFSIGIRGPRIVRDNKAANGRIIDGQIVEVSLVDRPANPNAKLMLAKSDNGQDLVKVEEFEESIEKHGDHDQSDHNPHGGGGGKDKPEGERNSARNDGNTSMAAEQLSDTIYGVEDLRDEIINANGKETAESKAADKAAENLHDARESLEMASEAKTDKEHEEHIRDAKQSMNTAITALGTIQRNDADDLFDEVGSVYDDLLSYQDELIAGESKSSTAEIAKGETMEHEEDKAVSEKPSKEQALKRLELARKRYQKMEAMCKELGCTDEELKRAYGESAEEETEEGSEPTAAEEEVEEAEGKKPVPHKAAEGETEKCLECGCHQPTNSHGGGESTLPDGTTANMTTANMVSPTQTPKSTIIPEPVTEEIGTVIEEEETEDLSEKTITAIIEKAVKSAKDAVTGEINSYKEEINKLQSELATAKTKAVAGGPKRSVVKTEIAELGGFLAKAAEYRAKAAATSDSDLARGYRELADDAELKAKAIQAK